MNHTRPSSAAFVFERHRRDASSRKRTHVILLAVALFALLLGPDAAVASHVPSLLLHPEAATGWTNPSGALSQPDADYARTSADGASLAITGYADPTASGTITTVNLKIDQLQGSHSDDRYLFSANAAGCGQVNLDAPNPEATIGRQTLTTRVDCANGWTWDRLDTIAAAIQSDAQGGVGGIFDVDGEWRVYYAWLEVAYVNQAPTASAGPDRTVVEGAVVVLDGSGSVEPDGEAVSFTWTQVAGPVIALGGPSTSSPTFTAPVLPTNVPVV
ncbi:MAG TPA: PKD domain-containing protein, partial [Candidatus Thermoplasmatota archaeon]|nr:PKD domain-containing protein [Candidatus Thermoplasmatota archaeon]